MKSDLQRVRRPLPAPVPVVNAEDIALEDAAFRRVKLRSIRAEAELLEEEGGTLSATEFAERLGVRSRATVRRYRERNWIFAVSHNGRARFPAWQIHRHRLLRGLREVLTVPAIRQEPSSLGVLLFFLTAASALDGKRPVDALRQGQIDVVIKHAALRTTG